MRTAPALPTVIRSLAVLCAFAACLSAAESAVILPQLQQSAQSLALGQGGASLTGLNALGVNPAGLYTLHSEVSTQYQQLPLQTALTAFGVSHPLESLGTSVAASYLSLRSSNFDRRDDAGNQTGRFSTEDRLIGLHLSRPLALDFPLTLGASVKFLRMGIDGESADAVAFDLGGRYRLAELPLTLGLAALNLGRGPRFAGQESKLPTSYAFSGAYRLFGGLELVGGLTRRANEGKQDFNLGAQYWVGDLFAVRGRYGLASGGASQAGLQNFAAGVGFKLLSRHTIDYTFQPFETSLQRAGAGGQHMLTLTMSFGANAGQTRALPAPPVQTWSSREPQPRGEAARGLAEQAYSEIRLGRFARAAMRLEQACDADPKNRGLRQSLSRLRAVAGFMPEAPPDDDSAQVRDGVLSYVRRGASPQAVTLLRQAANERLGDAALLSLLNHVEQAAGADLTQRSMENPDQRLVDIKIAAARQAAYDSAPSLMIKRAQEALDIEPRNIVALELLGSARYIAGDKQEARAIWKRVLEIDPDNKEVARYLR